MNTHGPQDSDDRSAVVAALLLWALVTCGLLYGVIQTATKIPALFGG
jgi:hypothetical protein